LVKDLLIDWRWGQAYFAEKLNDYDLSANNGNWQWAAGCGCDAAPYFRIFNPTTQTLKFDKDLNYIRKWNLDFEEKIKSPIVEHTIARERCLKTYKKAVEEK
jgi:deoxyribodipyrimidine photo-lyase